MAAQPTVIWYDPAYVLNLPSHATSGSVVALNPGDLCTFESDDVMLMDAVTENDKFVGIAGGTIRTTPVIDADIYIPVYTHCIVHLNAAAGTDWALGAGFKYASKNTVEADANVDTIAWYFDETSKGGTEHQTRPRCLVHVPLFGAPADKIFDAVSA